MEEKTRGTLKKTVEGLGQANTVSLFGPESLKPQTSYEPVDPASAKPKQMDMSREAVETREKKASLSLIGPLLTVVGVVVIFAAAIFLK